MTKRFGSARLTALAVLVVASVVASCSTRPAEGPTPPTSPGTATSVGKPYGSLRVAGSYSSGRVDPQMGSPATWLSVGIAIFDTLLWVTPDWRLEPGIAERWEISPDGKTHTFYLRKGVKFHNGDDLTAADVKFSMEKMLAPETFNVPKGNVKIIANVEVKNDYTVALRLKEPQYEILQGLEGSLGVVMPKKYIEEKGYEYFSQNLVGSGPFRAVKVDTGPRVELEALESHWRKVPAFKNIEVLYIPSDATVIAMLRTGELDLAAVSADALPGLKTAGVRTFTYDGGDEIFGYHFYDVKHPERAAQGDVRVRKAMQLSINNKEIADNLFRGLAAPTALAGVSTSAYFFDPNVLKPSPYDPDQAKKLVAEAGYPNGFETRIFDTQGTTIYSTFNQGLSGYWRKVGIKADLVPIEMATFLPRMRNQTGDIWPSVWTNPVAKKMGFGGAEKFDSVNGIAKNHSNTKLNELVWAVPITPDPEQRKRIALEAMRMGQEEYVIFNFVSLHKVLGMSAKIGEVAPVMERGIPGQMFETITHAK